MHMLPVLDLWTLGLGVGVWVLTVGLIWCAAI